MTSHASWLDRYQTKVSKVGRREMSFMKKNPKNGVYLEKNEQQLGSEKKMEYSQKNYIFGV